MAEWIRIAPTLALLGFVVVAHFASAGPARRELRLLVTVFRHPLWRLTPGLARSAGSPPQNTLASLDVTSRPTSRHGRA